MKFVPGGRALEAEQHQGGIEGLHRGNLRIVHDFEQTGRDELKQDVEAHGEAAAGFHLAGPGKVFHG